MIQLNLKAKCLVKYKQNIWMIKDTFHLEGLTSHRSQAMSKQYCHLALLLRRMFESLDLSVP
jgi:hypothetical protein